MKSLKQFISDKLELIPDSDGVTQVFTATVKHILGGLDCPEYHRAIKDHANFSALEFSPKDFRLKLKDFGYAAFNIKFYLFSILKSKKVFKEARFYSRASEYRIEAEDICLCYHALKSDRTQELIKSLPRFSSFTRKQVYPKAFNFARRSLAKLAVDVEPHCKKLSVSKLAFITRYNGMEKHEYTSDLVLKAISAYYQMLPVDLEHKRKHNQDDRNLEYELNYMRRAATHHCSSIIKSNTTEGRGRLFNMGSDNGENAVYVVRTINESQISITAEDGQGVEDYSTFASLERSGALTNVEDFHLTVDRILSRMKPTKRKLVYKLLTKQSKKFEHWLEDNNLVRSNVKTAYDYFTEKPKETVAKTIGRYANLSVECVLKCMDELTSLLSDGETA